MKTNECGFSTPLAMSVILSLSVITLSFSMLVAAGGKKIDSFRKTVRARKEADSIIKGIGSEMQLLREYPCDTDDNNIVRSLVGSACKYSFSVRDASTGINKRIMGRKFRDSAAMEEYMSSCGEDAFTEYGWINPAYADEEMLESTAADFGREDLFPLVNGLPLFNAFNMEEEFARAVLEACGIEKAGEKSVRMKEMLSPGTSIKELSELFGVEETHPVFSLVGLKTAFWEVRFETDKCRASAVFAAVPYGDDQRSVEKYVLVRKSIRHKGGGGYE